MIKKGFVKYARAVSDEAERRRLYKKYVALIVALIISCAMCLAVIGSAVILDKRSQENHIVLIIMEGVWIIVGIVALCLWLTFKRSYKAILKRPATQGEMPAVASYRQKAMKDMLSTHKKLWWTWLVLGICFAAFIACNIMLIKNFNNFSVWGYVSIFVLLAGFLTVVLANPINRMFKQQQGTSFEQLTAKEAVVIDRAQGRTVKYDIHADANAREDKMYEYLFPNVELRATANRERAKRTKILTVVGIIIAIIAVVAGGVLMYSERLFGINICGYALPVALTVLFGGIITFSLATGGKLKAIEKRQKAELESNPAYAKNLEWYRLHKGFYKFKGRIILIFVAVGIALSWVLCVIFPSSWWSVLSVVPMVVGLVLNNIFVKNLRKKALVIEREIDNRQPGYIDKRQ